MGEIITLGRNDIHHIQDIAYKTWPVTFADILSKNQIEYMLNLMYSKEALENQMERKCSFYGVKDGEEIAGFISTQVLQNEKSIKIHKLYVKPAFQKKSYGSKLIQQAIKLGKEMDLKTVSLNVNRFNKAIDFYLVKGFKIVGNEDIDIGNGYLMEDYIMHLKVSD